MGFRVYFRSVREGLLVRRVGKFGKSAKWWTVSNCAFRLEGLGCGGSFGDEGFRFEGLGLTIQAVELSSGIRHGIMV